MATAKRKFSDPARQKLLLETYERLKKVRASTTVTLKPSRFIRSRVTALDGSETDFRLRYYQVQGAYHLLVMKRMILGDDAGLGKCVTGDTILTTDQGLMPIWQLAPEHELAPDTFHEPRLPVRVWTGSVWAPVRGFYWNGPAETRRVTTRNGYTIEGTLVHPILVRDTETGVEAFVKLADLDPSRHSVCIDRAPNRFASEEPLIPLRGDFAPHARRYAWPPRLTPDLARLLGYIVGEAWTGNRYTLSVTQHRDLNPEVHEDIRDLFQKVYGWSGNDGSATKDITISVNSIFIREHLSSCGIDIALAAKKRIPWIIARGAEASAREFLRGLLDCEGSVGMGGLEFSSASRWLARGVQQLLLRFGVVSTLTKRRVGGRPHTYWRLTFFGDDARQFMNRVGLVSTRKVAALSEALECASNPNKDVVPGMGPYFERVRERLGTINRFGNNVRAVFPRVIAGDRNPTYQFLSKLKGIVEAERLPEVEVLDSILENRFYYDPIATIEEGHAPVMDIEVDHPTHCFVGNGFINHNTIEGIAAFTHMLERDPKAKVIIITPKSTVRQWAAEIRRFTTGIRPIIIETKAKKKNGPTPLEQRKALYAEWANAPTGPDDERVVLIMNYALLIRDWNAEGFRPVKPDGKPDHKQPVVPGILDRFTKDVSEQGPHLITFLDECQAFRNMRTKTWEAARFLSDRSERVYGLTATPLTSDLIEGYCLYKAIKPELFTTKTKFMEAYCHTKLQDVPGSKRKIPIVVGYHSLDHFRGRIDPFYLGRRKHEVSDELPVLISKDIVCELTVAEERKYAEALTGILELGDGVIKDFEEHRALVSLIYCQQVVDSLSLLKFEKGADLGTEFDIETLDSKTIQVGELGAKEEALLDLLSIDGELDGQKVIVYTRFASLVPRLQKILERQQIESVRITGMENDKKRTAAQEAFQDPKSRVKVIFITDAGGVGINLQMAQSLIFYDLPWTWGAYVQTLGRMIRIGSPHRGVVVYHLMAERPLQHQRKTIDHHVHKLLRAKKHLIDQVLGEAAVGALDVEKGSKNVKELLLALQSDGVKGSRAA